MDVFRIFVTTDTHLGYKDRDEFRHNDSFAALQEALHIARTFETEILLHSGDLFDVQKPSQHTLHRATKLFAHYCLGPNKLTFDTIQRHDVRRIYNYERTQIVQISLPVFVIHGNHDPPLSREGGTDVVSPLDLLEAAHLINDIGRTDDLDLVQIKPVVLQKGRTKIAIYGVGYVRDERMNRLFKLEKIKFENPSDPNTFNILMIHQNRYKGQAIGGVPAKKCIHEEMIPSFFDLVIWGHEHDCEIAPRESLTAKCHIMQPGSSVYTSFKRGEATYKKNAILEVCDRKFRYHIFPLLTPRAFAFRHCLVSKEADLWVKLETEVAAALFDAQKFNEGRLEEWMKSLEYMRNDLGLPSLDLHQTIVSIKNMNDNKLPLVRIRVELHPDFNNDTFYHSRFNANYINKVANPDDILLISKSSRSRRSTASDETKIDIELAHSEDSGVKELIFNYIGNDAGLTLLSEIEMNEAVQKYATKTDIYALDTLVDISAKRAIHKLSDSFDMDESMLINTMRNLKSGLREAKTVSREHLND